MKMPLMKIIECAPAWYETATTDENEVASKYEIRVTVTIDGISTVFSFTPLQVLRVLCDHFTFYKFHHTSFTTSTEIENDTIALSNNFYNWKERNYANLERIVLAYLSKYNPIENYNGTMTIIDESEEDNPFTRTKTISGKVENSLETENISKSGATISGDNTSFADAETKTYNTAYNATTDPTDAKLKEMTTQNPIGAYGKTTQDPTKNYTTWDNYAETETESGGKTHTEERHGNLGVTTSQSMVEDELNLRKHDILVDFLYQYVKDNLFM